MLVPLLGFVLLDGLFLWMVLAVAFLFVLICLENDRPGWCTLDLVVILLVLQFFTNTRPLQLAMQNPLWILAGIVCYLTIGTGWLFFKWPLHVYKVKNRYEAIRDEKFAAFVRDYGPPSRNYQAATTRTISGVLGTPYFNADATMNDEGKQSFLKACAYDIGERTLPINIKVYKSRLYMWWICWPASVFWTVCADLLKNIWDFIYNTLGGYWQKISDASIKLPT